MTIDSSLKAALDTFVAQEQLPAAYLDTVQQWFLPLSEQIMQRLAVNQGTLVVGVSGCQGSGKSTLAALLVLLLKQQLGLRSVNLSIDDFYHTLATRQQLGAQVHPLLATRGVPGTHDVALALDTIRALGRSGPVKIPRFNKAIDDRVSRDQWTEVLGPVDVIVLEGWCLNIPAQPEADLVEPVNALEAAEDPDGVWRGYVNRQLEGEYRQLYAQIDFLVMLKAPDFNKVYEWRQNQEDKLAARSRDDGANRIMNREELRRFIQHYERLTRHGLDVLPAAADVVYQLTGEQTIAGCLKS